MEEENIKRGITLADVIKFLGVIGIVTPLLLGYFQYQRSVQQDKDNNFRVWVEKLSAEKKDERLSAAINLGTYLKLGDDYYEEARDILINTVSIEFDYNVLNAIRGSLEKVKDSDRKRVVQKLLEMDRNIFTYDYTLGKRLDDAEASLSASEEKLTNATIMLNLNTDANKLILKQLAEDLRIKTESKNRIEKDYYELISHQMIIASFVGTYLNSSRTEPLEGLEFYQSSFNYLVWLNFQIPKSRMENSAFSEMVLSNVDLNNSKIIGTTFQGTNFSNCSFAESEITATNFTNLYVKDRIDFSGAKFDDVFFQGSDLRYSNFKGAVGLKPIYFYKVKFLDEAQFDDSFRKELENASITDEQFILYVRNSKLIALRQNELLDVLFPQN